MATRPSSVPTFATDAGTRATLTTTRKATGFLPGEVLPALELNAAIGANNDWVGYLAALSPLSNTISGDSALGLFGGTNDAQRVRIALGNDQLIMNHGDIAAPNFSVWLPTIGWVHTRAGHVATVGTVDDGYRYGYSSTAAVSSTYLPSATPLPLDFPLTDSHSGWSGNETTTSVQYNLANGNVTLTYPASAATYTWYRGLGDALTGHNAEIVTAGGEVGRLVELAATLDASLGTDILVELIAQNRSTSVETKVFELPSSGTAHTGAAAAYTDTGAHVINRSTNRYYVRVTCVGTGSSGIVALRNLTLTIDKYAVE